jgi:DNA polymerase V
LPLVAGKVATGFPSPADDYIEKSLDLNELLMPKPASTFSVRAEGESMLGAGIHPNDILVGESFHRTCAGQNRRLCVNRRADRQEPGTQH